MECDLTGLDVANASLIDEAAAAAGAVNHPCRSAPASDDGNPSAMLTLASATLPFVVSPWVHPQTLAVVRTRADGLVVRIFVATRRQWTGLGWAKERPPLRRAAVAAVPRHVRLR